MLTQNNIITESEESDFLKKLSNSYSDLKDKHVFLSKKYKFLYQEYEELKKKNLNLQKSIDDLFNPDIDERANYIAQLESFIVSKGLHKDHNNTFNKIFNRKNHVVSIKKYEKIKKERDYYIKLFQDKKDELNDFLFNRTHNYNQEVDKL